MSGEGKSTLVWQFKPGSNSAAKERKHVDEMAAGDLPVPNIRGGARCEAHRPTAGIKVFEYTKHFCNKIRIHSALECGFA